jgi:hypothetical protein
VTDIGVAALGGVEVQASLDEYPELGFQGGQSALPLLDFDEFGFELGSRWRSSLSLRIGSQVSSS